jgi:Resolvase, N terminal domain
MPRLATSFRHLVFGQPSRRTKTPLRAGLYARVSTHDQQTLPLQRRAMRDYAGTRGWTVAVESKEIGSGASVRELRQKLQDAARRRDIDVVIVWWLDRWGRSMADLVTTLHVQRQELRDLGVGFVSLTEALDLPTPVGVPWPDCWRSSPSLNTRSSVNESAPVWLMIWIEQCAATEDIRERFGPEKACLSINPSSSTMALVPFAIVAESLYFRLLRPIIAIGVRDVRWVGH